MPDPAPKTRRARQTAAAALPDPAPAPAAPRRARKSAAKDAALPLGDAVMADGAPGQDAALPHDARAVDHARLSGDVAQPVDPAGPPDVVDPRANDPGSPAPAAGTPTPAPDGFAAFGLDDRLLAAVAELGYEEPTPIQREAIPVLLDGRDLLAEAPTGTGKTAAFALPVLQRVTIGEAGPNTTSALVIVPTRELAMQVAEAFHVYGKGLDARVVPVYGGQPIGQQLRGLRRGVDVVVATPGRAGGAWRSS